MIFKTVVLDGPLGKTNYYVIRAEFQARGTPLIYSFIWTLNAPKLKSSTIPEYTEWLDSIIRTDLPNANTEPQLCELVIGGITSKTIIAVPLPDILIQN